MKRPLILRPTSNVSISYGYIKCPFDKPIFVVNLQLKLFRATVANTDTESLTSLHILFDTYLNNMLAKFESNQKVQNLDLFDQKRTDVF